MKTVKVKMLSDEVNRSGDPLEKDSIQELTEDSAQYWIKRRKAELISDPKAKKNAFQGKQVDAAEQQRIADEAAARVAAEAEAARVADEAAAADQRARDEAAAKAAGGAGTGAAPK